MANRFQQDGSPTRTFRKVVTLSASTSEIASGPTDAIMVDIPAGSSPSQINVKIGGSNISLNNLIVGTIYPFRITHLLSSPGNDVVLGLYY